MILIVAKSYPVIQLQKFYRILMRHTHLELPGDVPVLLTAPHVHPPGAEVMIWQIVTAVSKASGAYALLGLVSRKILDLNREEAKSSTFRTRLSEIVKTKQIRYILDIHGFQYEESLPQIDIGTAKSVTARFQTP